MKTRIFIDAAGWYIAYYMGMWEYILEEFGRESFKGVYFDGVSAGGHVATHVIASIYGGKSMRTWLETGPKLAIKCDKYGIGRLSDGIHFTGHAFYNNLNENQRNAIRKYVRVFCADSFLRNHCCDKISNACEYTGAITATGNIPIIGSYKPIKFRDNYLWDGALSPSYSTQVDSQTLYITFTPSTTLYDNLLDLSNWVFYTPIIALGPSFLPKELTTILCDDLFDSGYKDAQLHRGELLTKFKRIGIKL